MKCKELNKLIKYLEDNNIEYEDRSDTMIERLRFENNKDKVVSVIHGYGTYGGYNRIEPDKGLLEVMTWEVNGSGDCDDPDGCLTAKDVIKNYIEER